MFSSGKKCVSIDRSTVRIPSLAVVLGRVFLCQIVSLCFLVLCGFLFHQVIQSSMSPMENFSLFTILQQWIPQVILWSLISSFFFLNLTLTACLIASGSHTWKANEQLIHVCLFLDTHNYTDLHYTFHLSSFCRMKICTLFSHSASGRSSGDLIILLLLSEGFPVLLHFLR